MGYVYQQIGKFWEIGFYKPDGEWVCESGYRDKNDAVQRLRWLNGGDIRSDD